MVQTVVFMLAKFADAAQMDGNYIEIRSICAVNGAQPEMEHWLGYQADRRRP
ncbi:hypothetical protein M5E06_32530 [Azospirillum sp. A1-3]|uniref:hypothetical protein n=1 Tax=Azospirillum sp. A1-3 TaxID=185874 RepID=UPI00207709DE|nr:hypothetical protein [Azospirillum sp. A1-3]MCM8738819.1 hypothetical protein [Azospirillum sp. A1-3]